MIEKDRIEKTGVPIIEGRVNGLNLTRSIGDFKHKTVPGLAFNKQPVICVPDVTEVERKENDEFVLLACDGLWEAYGDDHVKLTKYFQLQLQKSHALDALKNFFDKNLSKNKTIGPYGKDNMTGIIIELKKLRK